MHQLFTKDPNPADYVMYASARNKNCSSFKPQINFDEFRDALTSTQANDKFRNIMRQIRKKIVQDRL